MDDPRSGIDFILWNQLISIYPKIKTSWRLSTTGRIITCENLFNRAEINVNFGLSPVIRQNYCLRVDSTFVKYMMFQVAFVSFINCCVCIVVMHVLSPLLVLWIFPGIAFKLETDMPLGALNRIITTLHIYILLGIIMTLVPPFCSHCDTLDTEHFFSFFPHGDSLWSPWGNHKEKNNISMKYKPNT